MVVRDREFVEGSGRPSATRIGSRARPVTRLRVLPVASSSARMLATTGHLPWENRIRLVLLIQPHHLLYFLHAQLIDALLRGPRFPRQALSVALVPFYMPKAFALDTRMLHNI